MKVTNPLTKTNIAEICAGIFRISTPVPPNPALPAGFTFNQYLVVDHEPLLFHTGPRKLFPVVREAIESVIPASSLRYLGLSHFEADECGSLNEFLEIAPQAQPLCGNVAKMVSVDDVADRSARGMADGEQLCLGEHTVRWFDAPHLPHGWECGLSLRGEHAHSVLRGPVHTARRRARPARRDRHSGTQRGDAQPDGLLRPRQEHERPARQARGYRADQPGVHAWLGVDGEWLRSSGRTC